MTDDGRLDMTDARKCPFCSSTVLGVAKRYDVLDGDQLAVRCEAMLCEAVGPWRENLDHAVFSWNEAMRA